MSGRGGVLGWPILLMVMGVLAGCAGPGSPPTRFFLLTAQIGQEEGRLGADRKAGLVVELEPVEIPQYLNRPEMVTRAGGNRLQLERMNQWGGDLKEDIGRVTMENLGRLLHSERVTLLPGRSEGEPDFRLVTSIHRFEPDEAGEVVLEARWILFDGRGGQLETRHARLVQRAARADDQDALVKAMSQALAEWAREMGVVILARAKDGKKGKR
ncbi:MAG: membrane integrity-associated transporter subunit PqiC [Magnetococcales bacterium]|nr:membrane integrity-associated transporter subunit PqiC [Magnetococcales bacterium]